MTLFQIIKRKKGVVSVLNVFLDTLLEIIIYDNL